VTGGPARPEIYSRRAWLATRALDVLPWPWGERALSALFVAAALARPTRLRRALAWAGQQSGGAKGRWRLALSCSAEHGRSVARQALVGIRTPEDLRRLVAVEGAEHLEGRTGGAILLGFHTGPLGVPVALRAAGVHLTWMGGPRDAARWSAEAWRAQREIDASLEMARGAALSQPAESRGALLYQARRFLLDGGVVYVAAGGWGREAFVVQLPGGAARVRSGWFILRRGCGVPVLPVLARLSGQTLVITIHPPLPPPVPDAAADLEACRARIAPLLEDYLRRFPQQCFALMRRASLGRR